MPQPIILPGQISPFGRFVQSFGQGMQQVNALKMKMALANRQMRMKQRYAEQAQEAQDARHEEIYNQAQSELPKDYRIINMGDGKFKVIAPPKKKDVETWGSPQTDKTSGRRFQTSSRGQFKWFDPVAPKTPEQITAEAEAREKPKRVTAGVKRIADDLRAEAKTPTTAMGNFLSSGDKTPEEILAYHKSLQKDPSISVASLTKDALGGNQEAKDLLAEMDKRKVAAAGAMGQASTEGKLAGLQTYMDLEGTANAVLKGHEVIENVRNTFGVPIQEIVRQIVFSKEPGFNFLQPRAQYAAFKSSLQQQQKNRGMMGSFVKNINGQVSKLEKISRDIIKRVGVRGLDLPWRQLKTRFVGSGHENVFAAYMKEVSAEISKLSQGSASSVAQLPEENRKEWEKIHDVNLSMKELLIVLRGTREMANIRLQSVQNEIDDTVALLGNIRTNKTRPIPQNTPVEDLTDDEILRSLNAP